MFRDETVTQVAERFLRRASDSASLEFVQTRRLKPALEPLFISLLLSPPWLRFILFYALGSVGVSCTKIAGEVRTLH